MIILLSILVLSAGCAGTSKSVDTAQDPLLEEDGASEATASERYDEDFRAAERQARKEGLGIWGDPELTQKYLRLKSKWGQSAARIK